MAASLLCHAVSSTPMLPGPGTLIWKLVLPLRLTRTCDTVKWLFGGARTARPPIRPNLPNRPRPATRRAMR